MPIRIEFIDRTLCATSAVFVLCTNKNRHARVDVLLLLITVQLLFSHGSSKTMNGPNFQLDYFSL